LSDGVTNGDSGSTFGTGAATAGGANFLARAATTV